jgi:hypothetical protein
VVANRTAEPLKLTVLLDDKPPQILSLGAGDSRPLTAETRARVRLMEAAGPRDYELQPDCAYFVGESSDKRSLVFSAIGLGEAPGRTWPAPMRRPVAMAAPGVITVKILVDDDELRLQRVWEPAIRKRLADASAILEAHCGVQLRVVAVGEWDSDDIEIDFHASLAEFEREVRPAPAQVAIGFSSQYAIAQGRVHMGGTRGPLHTHIILKERARNVRDTERLELLVHELGHFMGASHSPEPRSVMRPVLGEGQQRLLSARIQFDPVNTLLMSLLAEEIRERGLRNLSDVSAPTRRRMAEIYAALNPSLPDDPATSHYLRLIAAAGARPVIDDTRHILGQIVRVAKVHRLLRERAAEEGAATPDVDVPKGDQLLEFYVRQAALAAKQVRRDTAPQALLLALGIALDDEGALRKLPVAGSIAAHLEGETKRAERIVAIGQPTMRGRPDLAKHFFVSAHLVALTGSQPARGAGFAKELLDAHGGSGFSFRDMAANRAGIVFAHALLSGRLSIDDVAKRFTVDAFLPPVDDLRDDMGAAELYRDFGGVGDERLTSELSRIEARIMALPIYQAATATLPAE